MGITMEELNDLVTQIIGEDWYAQETNVPLFSNAGEDGYIKWSIRIQNKKNLSNELPTHSFLVDANFRMKPINQLKWFLNMIKAEIDYPMEEGGFIN